MDDTPHINDRMIARQKATGANALDCVVAVTAGMTEVRDEDGCDWIVFHKTTPSFIEADSDSVNLDDFGMVAEVRFNGGHSAHTQEQLGTLFRITNSVDEAWYQEFVKPEYHEIFVMSLDPDARYRSTSVGDLFYNGNTGTYHEVAGCGWNEVTT